MRPSSYFVQYLVFIFSMIARHAARIMARTSCTPLISKQCGPSPLPPNVALPYKLLAKTRLSPDAYLLRFQVPHQRKILGTDPTLPTCLKIDYPGGTDKSGNPKVLSKSYSPVTHPSAEGAFELVVKKYPIRPGGGVGAFLCDLDVGESVMGTLKKERVMHGSPAVQGRWDHVGLVAGGTGIAPLLQIARIVLESPVDEDTKIHVLSINRSEEDILMREELDRLAAERPDRFFVTYSLTGNCTTGAGASTSSPAPSFRRGRGSVEVARAALPPPTGDGKTMILVCGRDGFVETWAGPVARAPPSPDGSKGPKIQGPLLGILAEAGYDASEVFKY